MAGDPLSRLVIFPQNELALRAARMVVDAPGTLYNPLVLQGPAGAGKTSLLRGIADLAGARNPGTHVLFEDAGRLVERVTSALSRGSLPDLRSAFSTADVLLLDDLQELDGMARTQEEVIQILNALNDRSSQVVVASDTPLAELRNLLPPLRALLDRAVVVDIDLPDRTDRERIARRLAGERGIQLTEDAFRIIAESTSTIPSIDRVVDGLRGMDTPSLGDIFALLSPGSARPAAEVSEFDDFLADISRTVQVVVEKAPWRRRIAQAIVRWEAQGIDTRRLDEALKLDSAPDVDELIEAFDRDATRLLQIRRELPADPRLAALRDPDELERAESLLSSAGSQPGVEPDHSLDTLEETGPRYPWFLDPLRVDLTYTGVPERMSEGAR